MFISGAAARRLRQRVPEHRRCLDSVQRAAAEPRERGGMRRFQETGFLRVFLSNNSSSCILETVLPS